MKLEDPQIQQGLTKRIHRLEGQLRGIANMMETGRDCQEILQQLTAAKAALQSATAAFLEQYALQCMHDDSLSDSSKRENILKELISSIVKAN